MSTNQYSNVKMWKYFLKTIVILLFIFLFWQTILILLTIKESFTKIDTNSCGNQGITVTNHSKIPRLIHQMWKNNDLSTFPINNSFNEWKKSYPNYEIRFWTDRQIEHLIFEPEYEYLKSIYDSFTYSIQRADLARLLVLHAYGGIYADLDVFPSPKHIDELLSTNSSLIIPLSTTGTSIINHFIIAEKSSPILNYLLHQMKSKRFFRKIYLLPYLEVFSTGSFFLTRELNNYIQSSKDFRNSLKILSDNEVTSYIIHQQGRSWHFIDGFILNLINDQPFLSFFLFLLFLLISISIYKSSLLFSHFQKFIYKK